MAIKVNGTTVINDSRALSNIASVDSTTATAIGAAGVGGSTTKLVDNASVGTGTQIVVSFTGGYRYYNILIGGLTSTNYADLEARFTDSSGTTITGYEYVYAYNSPASNGLFVYPHIGFLPRNFYRPPASNNTASYFLTVSNPSSSTSTTSWTQNAGQWNSQETSVAYGCGLMTTVEVNNSIILFSNYAFSGGTYSVWGVN
jgi:hypothetical protein